MDYYNIKDFLNLIDENNIKRENNKVINTILYDILLEDNTKYYKINYDYESRLSIINANIYFNKNRNRLYFNKRDWSGVKIDTTKKCPKK